LISLQQAFSLLPYIYDKKHLHMLRITLNAVGQTRKAEIVHEKEKAIAKAKREKAKARTAPDDRGLEALQAGIRREQERLAGKAPKRSDAAAAAERETAVM
jgi:hypothetical protein